jgi:hypothetical protein
MAEDVRCTDGKRRTRWAAVLFVAAALAMTPVVWAQARGGSAAGFSPGFAGGARTGFAPGFAGGRGGVPPVGMNRPQRGITGGFRHRPHNGVGFGTAFLGSPFWYGDGWYDSPAAPAERETAEAPASPAVEPASPPAPPLMIERQGDRFVRLTDAQANAAVSPGEPEGKASRRAAVRGAKSEAPSPTKNDVPAVLVFRDGRQQDVASYSIIGSTLYESSSYYSSGYWTRKIQLADLDLPATLKLNQQRGVAFVLPGGPNQIVTRP